MQATKHPFDQTYNGHTIENPFASDEARYYVVETPRGVYLQTSTIDGTGMITDENFEEVSSKHISMITEELARIEAEEKKSRIKQALISTPDLSSVDLEWVIFSDIEIGDIIQARVFGGNPHGQAALLAKTSAYLLSVASGKPNEELLKEIEAKQSKINEVRKKFGLSEI